MEKEAFSVVSQNDTVLHPIYGKEALHASGTHIHRAVHLFIEGFGGTFVIQKKAAGTENAGKWSSAVSGHVKHLESYEEAVIREAKEELGLDVIKDDLLYILKAFPCKETGNEFVALYTYLIDREKEQIEIGSEEVDEIMTVPLGDLIVDVSENTDDYSPAFIELFQCWLEVEKARR